MSVLEAKRKELFLTFPVWQEMCCGVFAKGQGHYSYFGRGEYKWVAVRSIYGDWAIYYGLSSESDDIVSKYGVKITDEDIIRILVPCDDTVFSFYRY